ncbi:rhomboid family intramembrane serine protease [Pseudomonas mangiferae]|uniref:Rhomboid family intramembrane serine protease n=1 Tax=Pseudomonas mangiferae TaxID=2593654 RepID=A0A553GX93_9PSED|nr:rhomboid family intramembrane serine protease [Pseudomonas mangiferae]TRX74103.1 rhomboid family intramembrane serine protease [Pseudomonas mangiferae]
MVILPAEQALDWKRPPLVTLLLILLNTLIYLGYQGGDAHRLESAVQAYLNAGLLDRERPLYQERPEAPAGRDMPARLPREAQAALILQDLAFEARLHRDPGYLADPAWGQARQRVEQVRDTLSVFRFGFIPARFTLQGLFGAMFLHGSFDHLLGNMVFLFVCGFAVELALGRWTYLALYLGGGLASHLLWWLCDPSWLPGIGASGAVAGVMGMYLGLYRLRRIRFFCWLGPMIGYFRAPALWILPVWMGKELYGLLRAADHVNYYAHLGGLAFGCLAVLALRGSGRQRVDDAYLEKVDPDAAFKRELAGLDGLIGTFELDRATERGTALLERYPHRLPLLERLYGVAKGRGDRVLMGTVLKQVFALAPSEGATLLRRLADDGDGSQQALARHPAIQQRLLPALLRLEDTTRALSVWRRLAKQQQLPADMPQLTLRLARQLAQRQDARSVAELNQSMRTHCPDSEAANQVAILHQHLSG